VGGGFIALSVLLEACTSTSPTAVKSHRQAALGTSFTVRDVRNPTLGDILVTNTGLALYTYASDIGHNGMSTCVAGCLQIWPALTVPAGTRPTGGPGVTGSLAAIGQANGTYQVSRDGLPLYRFVQDRAPGQVTGNGVGGFSVARNLGAPPVTTVPTTTTITAPPTPSIRSTTPSTAPPTTAPPPTAPPSTVPPPATTQPPATTTPPGTTTPTYYPY
jgi:predicted lipoprotein with Yx(FWY)xxD motif